MVPRKYQTLIVIPSYLQAESYYSPSKSSRQCVALKNIQNPPSDGKNLYGKLKARDAHPVHNPSGHSLAADGNILALGCEQHILEAREVRAIWP